VPLSNARRHSTRWRRGSAALIIAISVGAISVGLAGCSGAAAKSVPSPSSGSAQTAASPTSAANTSPASGVDKVLVIVEENRSVEDAEAHMPFLMSQARTYGTATNFYAIRHPSLPNYLTLAGGSTFGVTDDGDPDEHPLEGPSLFGQLVSAGRTAKTYADAMPTNCARENHDSYAARHNPWTYFDDSAERAACEQFDVPSGSPTGGALIDDVNSGQLPTFALLVPDICHDGHDCSAATTDEWLQSWVPVIEKGPDFRSNRLAIVITWDEDDDHSGNQVPMVVIHPSLKDEQVTKRLDHYGLSASIARLGGIQPLRDADNRTDALAAFGL
jgi:hypothetical protein